MSDDDDRPVQNDERTRDWDAAKAENLRRYADAAAGLLGDLEALGFSVRNMAGLRASGVGDRRAVPVLIDWLPRIEYRPLKEDVIATLGSRWARPMAARPLVAEFWRLDPTEDPGPNSVRWCICDALERVADETVLDELIEIACDANHGTQRALVVMSLGKMRRARDRVVPVLLGLLEDEDVAGYAVIGLGKLKAPEARAAIEPFLDDPNAWVRKEAKRALAKLPT